MTTTYKLFWTRADGQGDIAMGEYPTYAAAESAIPDALAALIAQCDEPEHADEIRVGRWDVVPSAG